MLLIHWTSAAITLWISQPNRRRIQPFRRSGRRLKFHYGTLRRRWLVESSLYCTSEVRVTRALSVIVLYLRSCKNGKEDTDPKGRLRRRRGSCAICAICRSAADHYYSVASRGRFDLLRFPRRRMARRSGIIATMS